MNQQGVRIEELDLSDNKLTEVGAKAIAEAMMRCPQLVVIDISSNRIGTAGTAAIASALQEHPSIEDLCLEKNRLGDKCASVVLEAASVHPSLTKLDISDNLLGDSPGEAFGKAVSDFLETNTVITHLDLSYNRIGTNRAGAERLAEGLGSNSTLKFLDLSMNAMRDRGGCALGSALRYNTGLRELNLRNNTIGEKGAMVIADALHENKGLEDITLDDNPVGPRGGRAIFRAFKALVYMRRDCDINIKGCSFNLPDPSKDPKISPNDVEGFDRSDPGGTWMCDVSIPYERMVANELVDLAWVEEGENWMDETMDGKDFELPEPPPGVIWTRDDYKLPEEGIMKVTYISSKRTAKLSDALDESTCSALRDFTTEYAENPRRPVLQLGLDALQEVLEDGEEEQVLRTHFSEFGDVTLIEFVIYEDGQGWVPSPNGAEDATSAFVHFANAKMAEKVMQMVDGDGDGELDKAGGIYTHPAAGEIDLDPEWASELSTAPNKIADLLRLVGSEAFFTARQIATLIQMFTEDHDDFVHWKIQVLSFLIQRCVDMHKWNSEVMDFLDEEAFNALEDKLGSLMFYFTGNNPTGHYKLQLMNPLQRIIMTRLVEISIDERTTRRHDADGDGSIDAVNTSQKGDWDNWRNERIDYYDGNGIQPYDFDEKRPWDLPKDGMIECDYVSTNAAFREADVPPMDDETFEHFQDDLQVLWKVVQVGVSPPKAEVLEEFLESTNSTAAARRGAASIARADAAEKAKAEFRKNHFADAMKAFGQMRAKELKNELTKRNLDTSATADTQAGQREEFVQRLKPAAEEEAAAVEPEPDVAGDEREAGKIEKRPPWQIPRQALPVYFQDEDSRLELIAQRVLLMLRRSTNECYFSAAQTRAIMAEVPAAAKVEALIILFSRITDIENHAAHELLSAEEMVQYKRRVGVANIFNPFKADVRYDLDLRVRDERAVAKLLVEMTAEKGENWVDETYNGNPFEMGAHWVTDGPPNIGMLGLTFLTNPGTANLFMRTAMARRLLMPGPGRWRAIPDELREPGQGDENGDEIDELAGNVVVKRHDLL